MRSALFILTALTGLAMAYADDARTRGRVVVTDEARRIHAEAIVIDGHNDLPYQFREKHDMRFDRIDITKHQPNLHTDIPRPIKVGAGAQFWAAYAEAETRKAQAA